MVASREALLDHEEQEANRQAPSSAAEDVRLSPWSAIGPFHERGKKAFGFVFPPEQEIDLTKGYEDGKLRWAKRANLVDGIVHPLRGGSEAATYLYRTLTTDKPKTVTGYFGSDDYLTVWFNGKKIIASQAPRGPAPNQNKAPLPLRVGENTLLLKITNRSGGYGFYFSTSPKPSKRNPRRDARDGLWRLVQRDFPDAAARRQMSWEQEDKVWDQDWPPGQLAALGRRYAKATRIESLAKQAKTLAASVKDTQGLDAVRSIYYQARSLDADIARVRTFDFEALERAIADLTKTFAGDYPNGPQHLARMAVLKKGREVVLARATQGDLSVQPALAELAEGLRRLQADALLANPLIDFDRLLVIKRRANRMGLPANWQGNSSISSKGYDNEIAVLSPLALDAKLSTLYRPDGGKFVGDMCPHFSADRLLVSMPGTHDRWQVFEMGIDGTGLRQVTVGDQPDVDNFDACYLPDGRIIFCSTACHQGVPCVGGGSYVSLLYIMDGDGQNVRQLTFDQDHSWDPVVLNNGRVLFTRWEYSDTPHYFTRLLFHMNPDGTAQMEYYGSNSYWPNSIFYARPISGDPSKVVAIVSGHHGVRRMGELVIFDPNRGRHEADGVVQRIPGYGKKVEPIIRDTLVNRVWPKFLHPHPLSEKYFLVSCQPTPRDAWGLYLADVFDNLLPICVADGYALLEPTPVRTRAKPPVVRDRVRLSRQDAVIYMQDVYEGGGLAGVPRGTVKALRVFEFHFAYRHMGGHIHIGIDGPWDVHRIAGTVPVHADGSAMFRAPANTSLAVQPIDAEGKALQVMRSWMTAMPGETLSCVGCHEPQNTTPVNRPTSASMREPARISPWYGPKRGFGFEREVQPVLDEHCVGCHNGKPRPDGTRIPDFRAKKLVEGYKGRFTPAYEALHRYVRRPGPESDYHLLTPLEYHADTSELVQMLQKGHHRVKLDAVAWSRLITWIDLNAPCHGTWQEHKPIPRGGRERRRELSKLYACMTCDPESDCEREVAQPESPESLAKPVEEPRTPNPQSPIGNRQSAIPNPKCPNWPFDATEAKRRQSAAGPAERTVDLGNGLSMQLVLIPAGEFVMGDPSGCRDEQPLARVRIERPFWMGKFEVTNEQYALFDPSHDSRYISQLNKDQSVRGYPANRPKQPVVRVSWQRAMAFCQWLSDKTGEKFAVPTEAQWEYACRAGAATPLHFGDLNADFSKFANLADATLKKMTRRDSPDWIPKDARFNDGAMVTVDVGRYSPNAWGLHDLHGNAAEWTRNEYGSYPGADDRPSRAPRRVVRGGSWYDRPKRCRSASRVSYPSWQRVYNVGFRVVCARTTER